MSLDQAISEAIAKISKEYDVNMMMADKYMKYKEMNPEDIASSAHFQQALKDRSELEAFAKKLNAAAPLAKELARVAQEMVTGIPGTAQMMSLTLVKLNGVGAAAKAMKDSMAANLARAGALLHDATLMESARMEAHPKDLMYALDELDDKSPQRKALYDLGQEAGKHWQAMSGQIHEFRMVAAKLEQLMKEEGV
jgi:hypothetical protein